MSKKKSQAWSESKYEHPIQLQPGDVLSNDKINRLSESVSSIVGSMEKIMKNFYQKSIFKMDNIVSLKSIILSTL